MAVTLQSLLGTQTLDSIRSKVLGKLQGRGLPTTDWSATGIERTIVEMVALALQDLIVSGLPIVVGGGFVDYATGDWLTLNSAERYSNTRNAATYTQGTILLTNSTSSPIAITAGQLWFLFPSGNKYNGPLTGGTIPASGTLSITVQSESPNHSVATSSSDTAPLVNYNDNSGVYIFMITPLAGVTATNVAPTYSAVTQTGSGLGVVSPTGTPSLSHKVTLRVDTSGDAGGTLVYSFSVDGGSYTLGQTASSQTNMGGFTGLNMTLINGPTTPSFVAGTFYSWQCPGTWITQQGTDQETDTALISRDKSRWPSLASLAQIPGSPTLGFYDLLARQASNQVVQTLVQINATVNNEVDIYVAGQSAALDPSVINSIQTYLNSFNMITDKPVVMSPTPVAITLSNVTITAKQASLGAAQIALQSALQNYFASLGINASAAGGVIRHSRIIQIIEDIFGVVDVTDTTMTISGGGTPAVASLPLPTVAGVVQLPTWNQSVSDRISGNFTWVTV